LIVVDTNVISELFRPKPAVSVVTWLSQNESQIGLSVVTMAELCFGIALLPIGARKMALTARYELLKQQHQERILPFTIDYVHAFGQLRTHARTMGRALAISDGQIAATASVLGVPLATRNTKDFEMLDLTLLNP
jgi:toxin FitB